MIVRARLSSWNVIYSLNMGIACAISYWVMTHALASIVDKDSEFLGGMWAAVATLFVFRASRGDSLSAGASRLLATSVSFALCLAYLWFFPFTVLGLAALIGIGTLAMMLLGRQEDIVTTGITTVVVMVVAAISPTDAWQQPVLRLVDTVVGVGIGVGSKWAASYLYSRAVGK
ncbi:FUSC family protein [Bradyrhizobium sp. CB82]|uniref:FUSC family protein n=1 Tax=Bradyrhizobium sp. CB82 TaxID=3039159 RepID=UPI0024B26AAA|nr:FUSC family protein [Bradyrhizobium sp. CB82]WFU39117.1 FUSC family protein [Bradyrhizobium sp. CB82]